MFPFSPELTLVLRKGILTTVLKMVLWSIQDVAVSSHHSTTVAGALNPKSILKGSDDSVLHLKE
jgi:hypothetical protein